MRLALAVIFLLIPGCTPQDPVGTAKDVVASHERFAAAGDLDGVVSNVAEDIVVLVPGTPLIQGKDGFRHFYSGLLAMGQWEFRHDYDGAIVVGDAVVLHGVARGTLTPADQQAENFANNFLLILRKQDDGRVRFWRVAFAPGPQ